MPENTAPARALEGVRVLDLSRVLAGPWATQLLADLGADVIKIERPGTGDDTRGWGPPWFTHGEDSREAAYFTCANRGKRSLAVDISDADGAALVASLADEADVLVENFKVGALARYGLDYAVLSARNPRLVYCSISGFGQDGPYASLPGYDFIIQAMGGLMSLTGELGGPPMKAGVALTDILTGLYACNGILAALHQRSNTGRGQWVETSLLDVQVAALANQAAGYLAAGCDPQRHGNAHPSIVPYQAFETSTRTIALAVGNDAQFGQLCILLGREDLGRDPAYATNAGRVAGRDKLIPMLEAEFRRRTADEWIDALRAAGIPAGPVNTIGDVFADPHVQAREIRKDMPHAALGLVPGVACPVRLSASPPRGDLGPPVLDEHGTAIRALGWAAPCRPASKREESVQPQP